MDGRIILIVLLIVIIVWLNSKENYVSRDEKINTIKNWFANGGTSFRSYMSAVPDSDIVEYNQAKRAYVNAGSEKMIDELKKSVI